MKIIIAYMSMVIVYHPIQYDNYMSNQSIFLYIINYYNKQ